MADETTKPRVPTRRLRTSLAYDVNVYRCAWQRAYCRVVCVVEESPKRRRLEYRFVGMN